MFVLPSESLKMTLIHSPNRSPSQELMTSAYYSIREMSLEIALKAIFFQVERTGRFCWSEIAWHCLNRFIPP